LSAASSPGSVTRGIESWRSVSTPERVCSVVSTTSHRARPIGSWAGRGCVCDALIPGERSGLGRIHLMRGVPGRQVGFPRSSFGRRRPADGRDKFDPTVVVPLTAWPCGLGVGCVGGDSSQREIRRKNQRTLLSLRCLVGHGNALSTVTFGDESWWLSVVGDRLTKTDRRTLFTRSAKEPVSRHSWTAELDSMLTRIRCGFDSHQSPLLSMVAVV